MWNRAPAKVYAGKLLVITSRCVELTDLVSHGRAEADEGVTERRQLLHQALVPPAFLLLGDRPFRFGVVPGASVRLPTVENDRHLGLAGKFSREIGEE